MSEGSSNARFEVVRRLGAGGMGEVLLAWQLMPGGLSRLVVLKTILPHLADTKQYVDLFVREARIGASMSHRNLVQILDVTSLDGRPCIVMEFLRGIDVAQMLRRSILLQRIPSASDLIAVIAQAADGLGYAHEHTGPDGRKRSIIHRDVSPQNLYLTAEGAVKVLDFGVARAAEDPRTQTGELRGKFAYMAPEMLGGSSQTHSPSVDQFALGVMLWEGLTLRRLFFRASPVETVQAVAQLNVPAPSTVAGSSPLLDGPVLRALSRDPAKRYPTCGAFAAALREIASQLGPTSTESARVALLVRELAPETLGEITADGPTASGPAWLTEEANPNGTWAAPWEPMIEPPKPASRSMLPWALVGLGVLGSAGAMVAWQPTRAPSETPPTITVSFEGLPSGAVVEVDGRMIVGAIFRGAPSRVPHRLRVTLGDTEIIRSEPTWLSNQVVMLTERPSAAPTVPTVPAGHDVPATPPPTPTSTRPSAGRPMRPSEGRAAAGMSSGMRLPSLNSTYPDEGAPE